MRIVREGEFRLADLLGALSLVNDLGMGVPPEHALRTCFLAARLAAAMGVERHVAADAFYAALLQDLGCTAAAHEVAGFAGGDDIAFRGGSVKIDSERPREAMSYILGLAPDRSLPVRLQVILRMVIRGERAVGGFVQATCEVGARVADLLGAGSGVTLALGQVIERWDGKGLPAGLAGEQIGLPVRLIHVCSLAAIFAVSEGREAALSAVERGSGGALDPGIASAFLEHGPTFLDEMESADAWEGVLEAEPAPQRMVRGSDLDQIAEAFADVADLKSPFLTGHSRGVARLAERAASALGLAEGERHRIRRAGLLHDLGRVGVPTGIWEKQRRLTRSEWEQVRLHPYHTERILMRSPDLTALAAVAGMHHERLDGSGYHRGATGAPLAARILAAADAFRAMIEPRPHRPARLEEGAARELEAEARAGRLDPEVVRAVIHAAGEAPAKIRRAWPAGLTDREVEVLRLVARGLSNRAIAGRLVIAEKTAGNHVQHAYAKLGVSTRAAATLFVMQHGLLDP
ncbi:MAG: HD domain-containing phosphohydrolase [Actinomycetota bacterium]